MKTTLNFVFLCLFVLSITACAAAAPVNPTARPATVTIAPSATFTVTPSATPESTAPALPQSLQADGPAQLLLTTADWQTALNADTSLTDADRSALTLDLATRATALALDEVQSAKGAHTVWLAQSFKANIPDFEAEAQKINPNIQVKEIPTGSENNLDTINQQLASVQSSDIIILNISGQVVSMRAVGRVTIQTIIIDGAERNVLTGAVPRQLVVGATYRVDLPSAMQYGTPYLIFDDGQPKWVQVDGSGQIKVIFDPATQKWRDPTEPTPTIAPAEPNSYTPIRPTEVIDYDLHLVQEAELQKLFEQQFPVGIVTDTAGRPSSLALRLVNALPTGESDSTSPELPPAVFSEVSKVEITHISLADLLRTNPEFVQAVVQREASNWHVFQCVYPAKSGGSLPLEQAPTIPVEECAPAYSLTVVSITVLTADGTPVVIQKALGLKLTDPAYILKLLSTPEKQAMLNETTPVFEIILNTNRELKEKDSASGLDEPDNCFLFNHPFPNDPTMKYDLNWIQKIQDEYTVYLADAQANFLAREYSPKKTMTFFVERDTYCKLANNPEECKREFFDKIKTVSIQELIDAGALVAVTNPDGTTTFIIDRLLAGVVSW